MPETAETFGFGLGFDNLGDKRKTIDPVGKQVVFKRSKSKRKIIVLLRRQILVAKENNLVIEKRLVNLLDLLIRHSSANHKRETIAFSKRRQCAAYRLAILLVWRNYVKSVSERRRDETPAQRLGILGRKLDVSDVLAERLFPTRIRLPDRIGQYYWRRIPTRRIPNAPEHRLSYAA